MNKLLKIFLSLFMCVTLLSPVNVYAQEALVEQEETMTYPTGGILKLEENAADEQSLDVSDPRVSQQTFSFKDEKDLIMKFDDLIRDALLTGKTKVDISSMNLNKNTYSILNYMSHMSPYLLDKIKYTLYYNSSTNNWLYFTLSNPMSKEQTKKHIEQVDQKILEITFEARTTSNSTYSRMLSVHEWFVGHFDYYTNSQGVVPSNQSDFPSTCFKFSEMLASNIGVCMAYALGYKYILNYLGIDCYYNVSDPMWHAWNIVKLNGKYYHIDCTWDDPTPANPGIVHHTHFLRTDSSMRSLGYSGWNLTQYVCNDTSFENAYWLNAYSPIIDKNNGYIYYVGRYDNGRYLLRRNASNGETVKLRDVGYWYYKGDTSRIYLNPYSGLFYNNGNLFFNTRDGVYTYNMSSGTIKHLYNLDISVYGYACGMYTYGPKYYLGLKRDPSYTECTRTYSTTGLYTGNGYVGFNYSSMSIPAGQSKSLIVGFLPVGMTNNVTWSSSNPNIATVKSDLKNVSGIVTGVKPGTVTIYATTSTGKKASCTVTITDKQFSDVKAGKWYYEPVMNAYYEGLMTGTSETKFEPNAPMTRGMIATVIHRIAGKPKATYSGRFSDVGKSSYCANAVEWAAKNKVVSGYKNGKFGPNDNITRQDVAVILHNYAKSLGLNVTGTSLNKFADKSSVSSYAKPAMQWAVSVGILSGSTDKKTGKVYLNPRSNATRAECASMLLQAYKIFKKK